MGNKAVQIIYRSYQPQDCETVRRLHFDGLEEFGYPVDETSCAWDADLRDLENVYLKTGGFWVAEAEGKIVGMVGILRLDEETAELRRMRVDRAWRRQGIAARLCEIAEESCRERGIKRIQLLTESRMEAAQHLYQKLGYQLALVDHHDEYESRWYVKELSPLPPASTWQDLLRRSVRHFALLCGSWELESHPINLTDEQVSKLERYLELLLKRNQQFNLTAITDPREVAIKHFYDSLTCLAAIEPEAGAELVDIGSGAGFPGTVLALLRPDIRVTLLDSVLKVARFLEELASALELKNARVIRARAEDLAKQPEGRERYDFAVTRATGSPLQMGKWSRGLLKPGGELLLMKGPRGEEELAQSRSRLERLGLTFSHIVTLWLPEGAGERKLVVLEREG